MPDLAFEATILLRSEESGGALGAVEVAVPAGWPGPPLHRHAFDEAFYVLEGTLTFQLGEELVEAGPNTMVFAPGEAVHTIANRSAAPARYLLLVTPAGFERRFEPDGKGLPEVVTVGGQIGDGEAAPLDAVPRGINVVVRGGDGDGRIAVMDNAVSPSFPGPPLHHHAFDELFYVVEGEPTFQLGDAVVTRGPGGIAFAPGGSHHTWANHSGAPGRVLIVCTPAGFESYFGRMAAERAGTEPPAWALEPEPPTTVVGPQIPPR